MARAALMISLAGDPLRIRLCTFGPQPSNSSAITSSAFWAAARKEPVSSAARRRSSCDSSSANATAASGRITATTEISLIRDGSAKDFRCRAAARDCFDPSVATRTCMVRPPLWWSVRPSHDP